MPRKKRLRLNLTKYVTLLTSIISFMSRSFNLPGVADKKREKINEILFIIYCGRISSVVSGLDCRVRGPRFHSRGQTSAWGLGGSANL